MKVFNISDVETKQLKQRGLVNHTVAVGKQLLAPGSSADIPDDVVQQKLDCIDELVEWGVLAKHAPSKDYDGAAKVEMPKAEPKSMRAPAPRTGFSKKGG